MSYHFVHKYRLAFCIVFVCAAFSGCKATVDEDALQADDNSLGPTLRDEALQKATGMGWTDALEADRLSRGITHHGGVADSIALTPQVMAVSRVDAETVYPSLNGFGSLDTSAITADVRHVLDSLVAAIRNGTDITPLMADGMEHQGCFFADDVKAALSLPDIEYEPDIDRLDTISAQGASRYTAATVLTAAALDDPDTSMADEPLNVTAIYGEPFFGDDGSIMVKIRLTFEGRIADAEVALINDNTRDDAQSVAAKSDEESDDDNSDSGDDDRDNDGDDSNSGEDDNSNSDGDSNSDSSDNDDGINSSLDSGTNADEYKIVFLALDPF